MSGEEPAIAYGTLDTRIGYILRRAQIAVFQDFFHTVGAFEISPAQYSVLTVIEHNPGLIQTRVAEALGIKKTNFVAMIKELEARGLALRQPSLHDKRSFALHLSPGGRALMASLHAASAEHEAHVRASIGEEAYRTLFAPLRQVAQLGRRPDMVSGGGKGGD